ncbi:MAG TPA: DegT/DnrJ/EryC1/StrS family aminotransferase, partial [Stellaceae bacterium]|nr:DegT/DnrJ/EryC1/StrS family aminotransferase [Stellaceae bacterium]
MTGKIPQTDPRAAYLAHRAEIDRAIAGVLEGGRYILGEDVAGFEREFASYIGQAHGIGVASGTDALVLGLKALDLPPGSYVATVSHTAVATVAAIELAGLKPLLLDIERDFMTLDPKALARCLAKPPGKISAVIPVHLYGQAAYLDAILPLAKSHGLKLIEDCAQCHGATLGGKRLGQFGDLACFSFYPTKNLGAFGDGGAVLTGDPEFAKQIKALREYGWRQRYVSAVTGMNSRLDELQAAVLEVKLATLDAASLAPVLAAPPGRIVAVVPVHLYGQAADLDAILALARRHGVRVIEDCAQCHGAAYGERRLGGFGDLAAFSFYPTKNLGAFGDAAAFSFYPTKNLGALGDAGAVVSND